ncbi:hypothetical protein B7P43_G07712 [Cryptotermes secundus]|uniref:RNA-directed DNA polymerase n=1 Tax=Cryptotermes secundus TaxID=105785 RepID=A0A2J7PSG7_9NEOP|nr:hypothetical protein B7P43_G07712 [Cryptotermes secundus]
MDDLVVYSRSFEEYLDHLREVFRRLEKAGFTLNRDKVALAQSEIKILDYSLSSEGMKILPERFEATSQFPPPKNLKAVRRSLGMVGFYANFVKDFSQLAEPLHALKRKNAAFVWDGPQRQAFERLKSSIYTPPLLQVPDLRFLTPVTVQLANSDTAAILANAHVSQVKRYFADG